MVFVKIDTALEQFKHYRDTLGLKASTAKSVDTFVNWVHKNYPDQLFLDQGMLDVWAIQRSTEHWNSYYNRVGKIRSFVQYLNDRGYGPYLLPIIEKKKQYPNCRPMSSEDIISYFDAADRLSNLHLAQAQKSKPGVKQTQHRIDAIIIPVIPRTLYSTGIRPGEVRRLRRSSVNLNEGYIHLHVDEVKGYRERIVALHPSLVGLLSECDHLLDHIVPNRAYFFPDIKGGPLSSWWYNNVFRLCRPQTTGQPYVAYSLRHHYATANIARCDANSSSYDKDIFTLARSMGHSSLKSTLYYLHITPDIINLDE